MFSKLNDRSGFTLIELMIVVVIIGILAALAIPRFNDAGLRTKQREPKTMLQQIYEMQQVYRQQNDSYWAPQSAVVLNAKNPNAFSTLGVEVGPAAKYSYRFTEVSRSTFTCEARVESPGLDGDPSPDIWSIDQDGQLKCVTDDVIK